MKKKIILGIIGIVILGGIGYQAYVIYQLNNKVNILGQSISFLASPDKDGITGFDHLVVQTLSKIQASQKK